MRARPASVFVCWCPKARSFVDLLCAKLAPEMPDSGDAEGLEDWEREARHAAALYGARFHPLADVPLAYYIDGVLTPEECAHVISVAGPRLGAAHVSGSSSGYASSGRTNALCWLPHDADDTVARVVARISQILGLPPSFAESLQVIRYEPGQEYKPHFGPRARPPPPARAPRRRRELE